MNLLSVEKQNEIARWLKRGMSLRATSSLAGVNRETVLKYKKQIAAGKLALRYGPPIQDRRNPRATVFISLSRTSLDRLEDIGDQMQIDRRTLIARIVETVAKDDLFNAVLES